MYKMLFGYNDYDFGFSWTFDTLAEANSAAKEQEAKGYFTRIIRV
ncbi:hypothetical protein LCGC14_0619460 [marine sediment metagenome]|uniref:Uncharacterized protein n=1 Tax=marine sediment metagenome TaxID=412755 RepID=A0A0F9RAA2_9ZZZZ